MNTKQFAKKIFGASNISAIQEIDHNYRWKNKIVVFSPAASSDKMVFAMSAAGAGVIGNYSVCSFRTKGVGTFIGDSKSNPAAGRRNRFEMVEEVRLEMLVDSLHLDDVIDAMYAAHPYEEPAYEIYPVMLRDRRANDSVIAVSFKKKLPLKNVLAKLNATFSGESLSAFKGDIWSAIVDFSGNADAEAAVSGKKKVLYITRTSKSSYNIRLV